MTTALGQAVTAARKACPFVNQGAVLRIIQAAAPHLEAAARERIKALARDCGATGRGAGGPAEPFAELIDRHFASPAPEGTPDD